MSFYKKNKKLNINNAFDCVYKNGAIHLLTREIQHSRRYYSYVSDLDFIEPLSFSTDDSISPSINVDFFGMPNCLYGKFENNNYYINKIFHENTYDKYKENLVYSKEDIAVIKYGMLKETLRGYVFYVNNSTKHLHIDIFTNGDTAIIENSYDLGIYLNIYNALCKEIDGIIYVSFGYFDEDSEIYYIDFYVIDEAIIYNKTFSINNVQYFDFEKGELGQISFVFFKDYSIHRINFQIDTLTLFPIETLYIMPSNVYYYMYTVFNYKAFGMKICNNGGSLYAFVYGNFILRYFSENNSLNNFDMVGILNNKEPLKINRLWSFEDKIIISNNSSVSVYSLGTYEFKEEDIVINYDWGNVRATIGDSINPVVYIGDGIDICASSDGKTFNYSLIDRTS